MELGQGWQNMACGPDPANKEFCAAWPCPAQVCGAAWAMACAAGSTTLGCMVAGLGFLAAPSAAPLWLLLLGSLLLLNLVLLPEPQDPFTLYLLQGMPDGVGRSPWRAAGTPAGRTGSSVQKQNGLVGKDWGRGSARHCPAIASLAAHPWWPPYGGCRADRPHTIHAPPPWPASQNNCPSLACSFTADDHQETERLSDSRMLQVHESVMESQRFRFYPGS